MEILNNIILQAFNYFCRINLQATKEEKEISDKFREYKQWSDTEWQRTLFQPYIDIISL